MIHKEEKRKVQVERDIRHANKERQKIRAGYKLVDDPYIYVLLTSWIVEENISVKREGISNNKQTIGELMRKASKLLEKNEAIEAEMQDDADLLESGEILFQDQIRTCKQVFVPSILHSLLTIFQSGGSKESEQGIQKPKGCL